MAEATTTAIRAKTVKPDAATNTILNYALAAGVLLGVFAIALAILVW